MLFIFKNIKYLQTNDSEQNMTTETMFVDGMGGDWKQEEEKGTP